MKKVKYITLLFVILAIMLFIPNISNAATEYAYSDTEQGIEWGYELDASGKVVNLRCKTTSIIGAVTIPSTIEDKTVISLKGTFENCAGITSITIPNTIITIGVYAFENCTGLKSVTIPNSVTKIDTRAFEGCSGITSVTLSENLTSIGIYAFRNCTGLKSITIPNSVTTIGEGAFYGCSGLKELTLSQNLTKISDKTFENCTGLTSVILPESVTTIEGDYTNIYGAFGDCKNLAKILIPDTVASIGKGAFQGCDKLTIYGNNGMVSKQFAEEHGINFDYISNWNNEVGGTDISAPIVEDILVTYASVMKYDRDSNRSLYIVPEGAKLVINVFFDENIKGTTVPTLTIKFGDGENITITEGTISGSIISYIYTVQSKDKGIMATVDFSGGDITDEAGNIATLSCPALKVQYNSGDFVYANGTVTVQPGNNNQGKEENSDNNNNDPTANGTSDNNKKDKGDSGKTPVIYPDTGIGIKLITAIAFITIVGIVVYKKYNNLKDI